MYTPVRYSYYSCSTIQRVSYKDVYPGTDPASASEPSGVARLRPGELRNDMATAEELVVECRYAHHKWQRGRQRGRITTGNGETETFEWRTCTILKY